jgi:hypothetical protein
VFLDDSWSGQSVPSAGIFRLIGEFLEEHRSLSGGMPAPSFNTDNLKPALLWASSLICALSVFYRISSKLSYTIRNSRGPPRSNPGDPVLDNHVMILKRARKPSRIGLIPGRQHPGVGLICNSFFQARRSSSLIISSNSQLEDHQ